jgi:hypothetical protein
MSTDTSGRDCGFESRRGHERQPLLSVVCCQVEISVSGWLFVQKSPKECGVSECDCEASILKRPWPMLAVVSWKKIVWRTWVAWVTTATPVARTMTQTINHRGRDSVLESACGVCCGQQDNGTGASSSGTFFPLSLFFLSRSVLVHSSITDTPFNIVVK